MPMEASRPSCVKKPLTPDDCVELQQCESYRGVVEVDGAPTGRG